MLLVTLSWKHEGFVTSRSFWTSVGLKINGSAHLLSSSWKMGVWEWAKKLSRMFLCSYISFGEIFISPQSTRLQLLIVLMSPPSFCFPLERFGVLWWYLGTGRSVIPYGKRGGFHLIPVGFHRETPHTGCSQDWKVVSCLKENWKWSV